MVFFFSNNSFKLLNFLGFRLNNKALLPCPENLDYTPKYVGCIFGNYGPFSVGQNCQVTNIQGQYHDLLPPHTLLLSPPP